MRNHLTATAPSRRTNPRGFTLVELLVVISIIGILVALLMPAVNSARESGRRAQCSNNLHQMALGCLAHEAKFQFLPTGGWGCYWGGESDRGFGASQPGGWHYNILPFIDLADLHDLDKGLSQPGDTPTSNPARFSAGTKIAQTPVALFICPTRHKVAAFPELYSTFTNINPSKIIGRSDYAANAGSEITFDSGTTYPSCTPNICGPNPTYSPAYNWSGCPGTDYPNSPELANGVIYRASALPLALVKDGTSYTYLIGERYMCPDEYNSGQYDDNDQGWDQGYDYDTIRGTAFPPQRDRAGLCGAMNYSNLPTTSAMEQCEVIFGSAHPAGFNMAFCDGSVRKINYSIDPTLHQQLGNRNDGQPTQLQQVEAASSP